jgi:trigger factor
MPSVIRENIELLTDKLTITVTKEDYLPSFEKALKQFAKNANIPGFRKGMVPVGMVKKMHGLAIFTDEVLKSTEQGLTDYLRKEQLDIFAQPLPGDDNRADDFDINNPQDYSFSFEIGLKPQVDLHLETISLPRYKVEVTEEAVQEEVEKLQTKFGKMTEPESVDSVEHILNVNIEEADAEGNVIEEGIKKDNSLLVKYFTLEFQQKLIGLKNNDALTFQLTNAFEEKEREWLVKDLGLDSTDAIQLEKFFKMTITKIGFVEQRELNEEFFKEAIPYKEITTVAEFKAAIKEEIQAQWDKHAQNLLHHEIYHAMLETIKIDFPETFLKKWMQVGGEKRKSAEEVENEFPTFRSQLQWTLITDKIATDANLQVSEDEMRMSTKQQIMGYFGGMNMEMGLGNMDWIDSYVDKMMQDEQQMESTYRRLLTEKIFIHTEGLITSKETNISVDAFNELQQKHQH